MRSEEEVEAVLHRRAESGPRVPYRFVSLFRQGLRGNNKRSDAIQANCLECTGFSFIGVKECQVTDCLFYIYRMGPEIHAEAPEIEEGYDPVEELTGSKGGLCEQHSENREVGA